MINISILWTIDSYDPFLYKNLCGLDININLVCAARSYSSIQTADIISRNLHTININNNNTNNNKRNSMSDEEIYVFPYITTTPDYSESIQYEKKPKVLAAIDSYPEYHLCNYKHFEKFVMPYIKNIIWTKYSLYNSYSYHLSEYTVIIVSDKKFLEKAFGVKMEKGRLLKETFYYNKFGEIIPYYKGIVCPEEIKYTKSISNPKYLKIFL
jgi:hypothetical protein